MKTYIVLIMATMAVATGEVWLSIGMKQVGALTGGGAVQGGRDADEPMRAGRVFAHGALFLPIPHHALLGRSPLRHADDLPELSLRHHPRQVVPARTGLRLAVGG